LVEAIFVQGLKALQLDPLCSQFREFPFFSRISMQPRLAIVAACFAFGQACNPLTRLFPASVHSWSPDALPAHFSSSILIRLNSGAPRTAGLTLWANNSTQVASIDCELTHEPSKYAIGDLPEVTCPTPPLAVGTYSARFSSDRSCGDSSFKPLDSTVDVVEPAHLVAATPAHGPEKVETSVRISGSNLGGPHMFCKLIFPPAPGAKIGCSMHEADYGASEVTPTSAVCRIPAWPGPVLQDDGHGGMHPVPGAECSREVHIQITNDARVYSQEPIVFRYDAAVAAEILV